MIDNYKTFKFEDIDIQFISKQTGIIMICLNDVCKALRRETMIHNGKAMKLCPSSTEFKSRSGIISGWFIDIDDIAKLVDHISSQSKYPSKLCGKFEDWISKILSESTSANTTKKNEASEILEISNTTLRFKYKKAIIDFSLIEGRLYVNATQIGNIFNITPNHWLRRADVIRFMEKFVHDNIFPDLEGSQYISTRGKYGGTWIEERLGVEYTKWLNEKDPDIHSWYMERLKELLPDKYSSAVKIKKNKQAASIKIKLPNSLDESHKLIAKLYQQHSENEHKIEFYNDFVENRDAFKSSRIAEELDISSIRLHRFLEEQGVCQRKGKKWVVNMSHRSLQCEVPYLWTNPEGKTYSFGKVLRWTPSGREFIIDLFIKNNNL